MMNKHGSVPRCRRIHHRHTITETVWTRRRPQPRRLLPASQPSCAAIARLEFRAALVPSSSAGEEVAAHDRNNPQRLSSNLLRPGIAHRDRRYRYQQCQPVAECWPRSIAQHPHAAASFDARALCNLQASTKPLVFSARRFVRRHRLGS